LLDGIGNGVQILQAANTGLTSLQALVAHAQSIAHQVLQTPTGYTTKSNVSSNTLTGATASNLLAANTSPVTGSVINNDNTGTAAAITTATLLSGTGTTSSHDLATAISTTDTLVINGTTFAFVAGTSSSGTSIGIGDNVAHLLSTINAAAGVTASISGGAITVAGSTAGLTLSGTALAKLGLTSVGDGLAGQTLTIAATGGGTATSITFGLGTGQVSTLNDLNAKLAANNLQATIDSATGKINLVTTNDAASSTIGTIGGTAVSTGGAFNGQSVVAPLADPTAQSQRTALVAQYNN